MFLLGKPIMEPIWKEDSKTPWTTRWNTNILVIFRPSKRPSLIPKNLGESPFTTRGISVTCFFYIVHHPQNKGHLFFSQNHLDYIFFLVHNVIFWLPWSDTKNKNFPCCFAGFRWGPRYVRRSSPIGTCFCSNQYWWWSNPSRDEVNPTKKKKTHPRKTDTPLKFDMEPEKKSLEKEIPFGNHHFQVPCYISGEYTPENTAFKWFSFYSNWVILSFHLNLPGRNPPS